MSFLPDAGAHHPQTGQAVSVAPLNIKKKVKKIRRRGLVSGVQLELPPSPQPSPSPPQTAITFTAEWDLAENSFVFTPFDSSYPRSSVSPHFVPNPIPVDVEDGTLPYSPALSTPSVYSQSMLSPHHPQLPFIQTTWSEQETTTETVSVEPSQTPGSSPGTPLSTIFDEESLYSHGRKLSQSTAASSIMDDSPISASAADASRSFDKEVEHSWPVPKRSERRADSESYEGMDRDLLVAPMHAFEQMLWDSTVAVSQPKQLRTHPTRSTSLSPTSRPLSDVPRSTEPRMSRFSSYSAQVSDTSVQLKSIQRLMSGRISQTVATMHYTPVPASSSLRQQLHMQISKALGTVLLKR